MHVDEVQLRVRACDDDDLITGAMRRGRGEDGDNWYRARALVDAG